MKNIWKTKELGEVCEYISRGISPKYTEINGIFVLNQKCVRNHEISYGEAKKHDKSVKSFSEEKLIKVGDVLVNSTGVGTLGRVAQVKFLKEPTVVDSHVTIVRPDKNIFDLNFFGWIMIFIEELIKEMGEGASGQIELSRSTLRGMKISYPESLSRQRDIVKVLDSVFTEAAKAKVNIQKNSQNTHELFDSYLQNIFVSKSQNWITNKLGNLTTKIGSGSTPRGGKNAYKKEGISLIRSLNIYDHDFKEKKLAFIDEHQSDKLKNVTVEQNDVLLNITGASVARCCIVPDRILPARVNQHVSIIRVDKTKILPDFLHYLLISKEYKDSLLKTGEKGGATRQAITKSQIQSFVIKYPPSIDDQKIITSEIKALFAEIKKLELIYKQKQINLEELKKSVLEKAFQGELIGEEVKEEKIDWFKLKQIIGVIIQNLGTNSTLRGEMVLAKYVYFLQEVLGIPTALKFEKHNFGPYNPAIKKAILGSSFGKDKFFSVRGTGESQVYALGQNSNKLFKYSTPELANAHSAMAQLVKEIGKLPSDRIELLATICKIIQDSQTVDQNVIKMEMKGWKTDKRDKPTKADIFDEKSVEKCLEWIKSHGWDKKLLK